MSLIAENMVRFAAEEGPSPVVPHTSEIIVGVIAFAILLFLVAKKVVPRFESIYAERTAAIEGGIAKAERAQEEAARALRARVSAHRGLRRRGWLGIGHS